MNLRLSSILQALVTVALLCWLFSDPGVRGSAALLRDADLRWAWLGLLAAGFSDLFAAARWWCCLHLAGLPVSFPRAVAQHFMGRFTTLFLPGSIGGDAVKIAWLAAEFPQRKFAGVLAVLMDRLTGFLAMLVAALIPAIGRREWLQSTPTTAGLSDGVLIFLAFASIGLLAWYISSRPRWLHCHPDWLPFRERIIEVAGVFDRFLGGGRRAAGALALSFLSLGTFFLVFHCAGRSLSADIAMIDLFSLMPTIDVVTMLPITLSGLGLREKAFETLLGALCGVAPGIAVLTSLTGFALYSAWSLPGAVILACYRLPAGARAAS